MDEVVIEPLPIDRFARVLSPEAYAEFDGALARGAQTLRDRTMWHLNATPKGGGVAEMLTSMLPYLRGGGIDCRWVVIDGDDDFLTITKRLHNRLHGFPGDDGDLGPDEAAHYAATQARNVAAFLPGVRAGDVVFVHDPQPAGMIPALVERGALVVWHCHIGTEEPNELARQAWEFLISGVSAADRYVFSRPDYLWDGLDPARLRVIRPSIDAFSPKNQQLDDATTDAMLKATGVLAGEATVPPVFTRRDGSTGTVRRGLTMVDGSGPVPDGVPVALQAARWDRLKDPTGVIDFFADHLAAAHPTVHLVLSGPSVGWLAVSMPTTGAYPRTRPARVAVGDRVAAVYDGVGRDTFGASLDCLRRRGTPALYAAASGPVPPVDPMRLQDAGSVFPHPADASRKTTGKLVLVP